MERLRTWQARTSELRSDQDEAAFVLPGVVQAQELGADLVESDGRSPEERGQVRCRLVGAAQVVTRGEPARPRLEIRGGTVEHAAEMRLGLLVAGQ